eukprot:758060-Hanusia_phi.AAC.3
MSGREHGGVPEDWPHGSDFVCCNSLPLRIETLKHTPLYENTREDLKEAVKKSIVVSTLRPDTHET